MYHHTHIKQNWNSPKAPSKKAGKKGAVGGFLSGASKPQKVQKVSIRHLPIYVYELI